MEAPSVKKEQNESPMEVFERYVALGKNEALDTLEERFEQSAEKHGSLEYHKRTHTEDSVIPNFIKIAEAIGLSEREIELGILIAAYHDIVQEWHGEKTKEGYRMRRRHSVENEEASFAELESYMLSVNGEAKEVIFTTSDFEIARNAILATIPSFEGGTVVQKNLEDTNSKLVAAVALADLATAGMEGPAAYKAGGDALFREENLDIAEDIKHVDTLPSDKKEAYRERMLAWTKSQEGFAAGRRDRTFYDDREGGGDLDVFLPEERANVRELFSQFQASIDAASALYTAREHMPFEKLARSMGYTIPNDDTHEAA